MPDRILAIIPARGGSKGIPRKSLRLLCGLPLIEYTIRNCHSSNRITKTIVSTDDEEIGLLSRRLGAEVLMRRPELARDNVPLAPVVYDVVNTLEDRGEIFDIVATVQLTSPLIRPSSLDTALDFFKDPEVDTVLSVYDNTHLNWTIDKNGQYKPLYTKRLNRQQLPKVLTETGGIIASRRCVITEDERIGTKIELAILYPDEAIDIDTYHDWWLVEKILKRKRIVFNIIGSKDNGLGHVYRARTLMHRLTDHEVMVIVDKKESLAAEMIRQSFFPLYEYSNSPIDLLKELEPDIVVNDILDTEPKLIHTMKENGWRVVNFEDNGTGADHADAVINSLYEGQHPSEHAYTGSDYYCLREEFLSIRKQKAKECVENILLCFGGTDPSGLTAKTVRAIGWLPANINLFVILGLGFKGTRSLELELSKLSCKSEVIRNTKVIGYFMEQADIMITSAGRTIYEAATVGVPTIVLCQNDRELHHLFATEENGFINLGLGSGVSEEAIGTEIQKLFNDWQLRCKMQYRMWQWDGRNGIERVIDIIVGNKR